MVVKNELLEELEVTTKNNFLFLSMYHAKDYFI